MVKFRALFSFSRNEITYAFSHAQFFKRILGLKLLQIAPEAKKSSPFDSCEHGKLLIVISRKTGKAHLRNLLRRRIKSIFYQHKLFEKQTYSILLVYAQAIQLSYEQLERVLISWFRDG